eukprot:a174592_974.p1 GENE.a174592_974~~a174592_974.p1  ORF type:complete len:995 (-),score=449.48 a174592_974:82-3030(-)
MADHDIDAPSSRPPVGKHSYALRRHGLFSNVMRHGLCQTVCIMFWWLLLAFAGLTVFAASVRFDKGNDPATAYIPRFSGVRLPVNTIPSHYELALRVDPGAKIFTGTLRIDVMLNFPTNHIVLHADPSLKISSYKFGASGTVPMAWPVVKAIPEAQLLYGQTSNVLRAGTYSLYFEFSATLQDKILEGLYLSKFKRADGTPDIMVSTQHEPIAARRTFPCFDEPRYKATFAISVSAPGALTVLSNMPLVSSETDADSAFAAAGYKRRTFAPTIRMSSYLVALAIGNFEYVEANSEDGIPVRVYVPVGNLPAAGLALDTSRRALSLFKKLFDVPYMLPKLDLVAIPSFAAGAMENWGLMTFRTNYLYYTNGVSSLDDMQRVVAVVCHEVAHQWAGNYVTMDWWNNLWLNEGFATFLEYECANELYPDWNMWEVFPEIELGPALSMGAHSTAHPLMAGNSSMDPSLIATLFDPVTYIKGAALFRMTQNYMATLVPGTGAASAFYLGLSDYFKNNALKTAEPASLWKALGNRAGSDVSRFIYSWIAQRGFPVVSVTVGNAAANGKVTVALAQKRFNLIPDDNDNTVWPVPVVISSGASTPATLNMISKSIQTVELDPPANPKCPDCKFYVANTGRPGYFRTNYTLDVWGAITDAITRDPSIFNEHDRTAFLDDSSTFFFAAQFPVEPALRLYLAMIKKGSTYFGWRAISRVTWNLMQAMRSPLGTDQSDLVAVQQFIVRKLDVADIFTSGRVALDFSPAPSGMPVFDQLRRAAVLEMALWAEFPAAVTAALNAYNASKFSANAIDPLLLQLVLDAACRAGKWSELEASFVAAHNAGQAEMAIAYLFAMTQAKEEFNLRNTLSYMMRYDNQGNYMVPPQSFASVITRVANSLHGGRELAFQYIVDSWESIRSNYGSNGNFNWDSIIGAVFGKFDTPEWAEKAKAFLDTNKAPWDSSSADLADETNVANVNFRKTMRTPALSWLAVV